MNYFDLGILIASSIADILLGVFLFLRNKKASPNQLFIFLTLSLVGWAIANYSSIAASSSASIFLAVKVLMAFVVLEITFFSLFVTIYPKGRFKNYRLVWPYLLVSFAIAVIGIEPGFFSGYSRLVQYISPHPAPFIVLFIAHATSSIIFIIYRLSSRYSKSTGLERTQYQFLILATVVLLVIAPISSFILPVGFHNYSLIPLGPIYTLLFAGVIFYSMARHKLFDIRSFIVRAAVYSTSVILLSLTLIVPAVLLVVLIMRVHFSWGRFIAAVAVVLGFALLYEPFHRRFNTITNKLFYRGYYEPQEVLDRLSGVLVRSIEVAYIKNQSQRVLQSAVRSNQFNYWLAPEADKTQPTYQVLTKLYSRASQANVLSFAEDLHNPELGLLQEQIGSDIALVVRLRTADALLGFITLGFKESGASYSDKDRQLLSVAADEIAIGLQNALRFEEIQNFNATLQQRVEVATHQLRQANEKLKALDETKDDFISMASHQLRTPLTSVKGYLSMVLEGDAGRITGSQKKMLQQAFTSSQRMVFLIADLLNVSRLKTGKFIIEPSSVNLAELVGQEMDQLVETAKGKDLTLIYNQPRNISVLALDETKTRQVIMNFVDNAIYYTPAGGKINVELTETPHAVEFRVVDNGIGVPASERHHLFTKFYRAKNAQKARPDGTGIGLFMAKKVIVAEGGSIIFDSEEGKGSTFGFSFPKSKLLVKSPAPAPAKVASHMASAESTKELIAK